MAEAKGGERGRTCLQAGGRGKAGWKTRPPLGLAMEGNGRVLVDSRNLSMPPRVHCRRCRLVLWRRCSPQSKRLRLILFPRSSCIRPPDQEF